MVRLLPALVFVVLASLAAVASGRVALDVSCKTADAEEAYAECATDCKAASDKRQRACNRTYRACRAGCDGGDRGRCRASCRKRFRDCSKSQRAKLRTCRGDCLETHGCRAGQ